MTEHFDRKVSFSHLLKYAIPSICTMVFFSLYTIVDGMFVSNFVGTDALGAVNIVFPVIALGIGIAVMIGSGGCALIGKYLGEKRDAEAKSLLTFFVITGVTIAILMSIIINIFIDKITYLLGADPINAPEQFEFGVSYLRTLSYFMPFHFLQGMFQVYLVLAGKPKLSLISIILAGITNMILDYLFIAVFNLGISGAALATGLSYLIPASTGIIYFSFNKTGYLRFTKFKLAWKELGNACLNGSSEMLTNLANAITTFLFNYQFLKYYGTDGVAAITIVLYFQFVISAALFGYSQGVSPIISYKYGEKNHRDLHHALKASLMFVALFSILAYGISYLLINPVTDLFSGGNQNVEQIVKEGFNYFAPSLGIMGLAIFGSAFFTSLNNGFVSAAISAARTLVFLSLSIMLVPLLLKGIGIWLAPTVAEILGLVTAVIFLFIYRKKYNY